MDRESVFAEARKNGATSREAARFCEIVTNAVTAEREECAEYAEGATVYTQFQTVEHYKIATFIAAVIRERSNVKLRGAL